MDCIKFNGDPISRRSYSPYIREAPTAQLFFYTRAFKPNYIQLRTVFVEKILRVQPNVKKLYLLLRAADDKSARERLCDEVIGKDLFKVLREKHGANLHSFISEKVTPVPGDITYEDLGVKDSSLKDEMWGEIDVVLNFAATTNFDESLIYAFSAYVCGEEGLILEEPFLMGKAKKGTDKIVSSTERRLMEEKLNQLQLESAPDCDVKSAMKDFGTERYYIPADMVVNAIIVAIEAHGDQQHSGIRYHLGSSLRNPVKISNLFDFFFRHFSKNPWVNNDGVTGKVNKMALLNSMANFNTYLTIHFLLPLKEENHDLSSGEWNQTDRARQLWNELLSVECSYSPLLLRVRVHYKNGYNLQTKT
ncbi:unnamed protein product [Dovyalis caffra]|uniref:Fatty acyl-CoA reductase n=1 Tax=Dovyalis caffra TaxID=77055 RepID=A0AAV1R7J4_9ROSI|nr:unnamed protein product [Dovyalis caffra]